MASKSPSQDCDLIAPNSTNKEQNTVPAPKNLESKALILQPITHICSTCVSSPIEFNGTTSPYKAKHMQKCLKDQGQESQTEIDRQKVLAKEHTYNTSKARNLSETPTTT